MLRFLYCGDFQATGADNIMKNTPFETNNTGKSHASVLAFIASDFKSIWTFQVPSEQVSDSFTIRRVREKVAIVAKLKQHSTALISLWFCSKMSAKEVDFFLMPTRYFDFAFEQNILYMSYKFCDFLLPIKCGFPSDPKYF